VCAREGTAGISAGAPSNSAAHARPFHEEKNSAPPLPLPPQDFRRCFPAFTDEVCVALFDLYRQVLHSARAHAEVRNFWGKTGKRARAAASVDLDTH
jgi:hypothetical protein